MKVIVEQPTYGFKLTLEYSRDDFSIHDFMDEVVSPMLHALGYHPSCIAEYLGPDDEFEAA